MSNPGAKKKLSVLQYNIFTSNSGYEEDRTRRQIENIKALNPPPDVICLQEMFIRETKHDIVKQLSNDYHIICSTHTYSKNNNSLGVLRSVLDKILSVFRSANSATQAYHQLIPHHHNINLFAMVLSFAALVMMCAFLVVGLHLEGGALAHAFAVVWLVVSVGTFPTVFPLVIKPMFPTVYGIVSGNKMGLAILVRKKSVVDQSIEKIYVTRFRNQAPVHTGLGWRSFFVSWFNAAFLSRGLMALLVNFETPIANKTNENGNNDAKQTKKGGSTNAKSGEGLTTTVPVLLCCSHFATGMDNTQRLGQVQEMVAMLNKASEKWKAEHVIIGCDTNAMDTSPEMIFLTNTTASPNTQIKWETRSNGDDKLVLTGGGDSTKSTDLLGKGAGYLDTFKHCNPKMEETCRHKGNTWDNENPLTQGNLSEPDQRVDYILHRSFLRRPTTPDLVCEQSSIIFDGKQTESDHYAVLTTFYWE